MMPVPLSNIPTKVKLHLRTIYPHESEIAPEDNIPNVILNEKPVNEKKAV
jgi:hypothetical protein